MLSVSGTYNSKIFDFTYVQKLAYSLFYKECKSKTTLNIFKIPSLGDTLGMYSYAH